MIRACQCNSSAGCACRYHAAWNDSALTCGVFWPRLCPTLVIWCSLRLALSRPGRMPSWSLRARQSADTNKPRSWQVHTVHMGRRQAASNQGMKLHQLSHRGVLAPEPVGLPSMWLQHLLCSSNSNGCRCKAPCSWWRSGLPPAPVKCSWSAEQTMHG